MSEERIRESYREIATERTPEHLDKAVLAEAARAARPRYSRLITWTRPLAWAATVVLSVALVLEITTTPAPELDFADEPASAVESGLQGLREQETEVEDAVSRDAAADAPSRDAYRAPAADPGRALTPGEEQKAAPIRSSAKQQATPEPAEEKREVVYEAEAFQPQDTDMRERAEDMMRMREGAVVTTQGVAAGVAAPGCDEAATAAVESWLDCIEDLEQAGFVDEARRQRELLAAAFPDFEQD